MLTLTIRPQGYMANQMVQYMFAKTIQSLTNRESRIIHYDENRFGHSDPGWKNELPKWNLNFPADDLSTEKSAWVRGNDIDFPKLMKEINAGKIDNVVVSGPQMNLRYFYGPEYYRSLFIPSPEDEAQIHQCADDEVLIHVRAGDVVEGAHRDYFPLPFGYYKDLIQKTGLKPVFMGQIGEDVYSTALKKEFADARFLERRSVVADFETMRRAKNVITSISSFAWLSTWLSTTVQTIYFPVAGFMNPFQRNDIDLVPRNDPRYRFFQFDSWKFNAKENDFDYIFSDKMKAHECGAGDIPFFPNRWHRGIHNKFKIIIPIPYNQKRHRRLSLASAAEIDTKNVKMS